LNDPETRLSTEEMAELSALADGSLPAERRAEVEARVAAAPELQEVLERQRRGFLATRGMAAEEVSASLEAEVEARRAALGAGKGRSRRRWPRLALAGAAAVAAVVAAAVVLSGGPAAPTVAAAARLATQPPTAPAPPRAPGSSRTLAIAVEGVAFPDFARAYGWHAVGVRAGRVGNRPAIVVVYGKDGRRLGYAIVGGSPLSHPAGTRLSVIHGVEYRTWPVSGLLAVTWQRGGRTCVLIGRATRAELLKLASWPL
jgi:anti-sigma factor RsiW